MKEKEKERDKRSGFVCGQLYVPQQEKGGNECVLGRIQLIFSPKNSIFPINEFESYMFSKLIVLQRFSPSFQKIGEFLDLFSP